MKTILIIINTIALVVGVLWMIESEFEYQPIILCITLIATLIGLFISSNEYNKSNVSGNHNEIFQTNSDKGIKNDVKIDGNSNKIKQK